MNSTDWTEGSIIEQRLGHCRKQSFCPIVPSVKLLTLILCAMSKNALYSPTVHKIHEWKCTSNALQWVRGGIFMCRSLGHDFWGFCVKNDILHPWWGQRKNYTFVEYFSILAENGTEGHVPVWLCWILLVSLRTYLHKRITGRNMQFVLAICILNAQYTCCIFFSFFALARE